MPADEGDSVQKEQELLEQIEAELRRIGIGDYLAQLMITLSSMTFQRLGLTPETAADRDLDQARLAVDAFAAVLEVWAPTRSTDEAAMFRSTLHQMRMAFVAAAAGPPAEAASQGDEGGPAEVSMSQGDEGGPAEESMSPGDDAPEEVPE